MHAAILAIWSIGLAGALIPTIFIFRLARSLMLKLQALLALSETIASAAHGIERNVSVIPAAREAR